MVASGEGAQPLALRSLIVLLAAEGRSSMEIARRQRCCFRLRASGGSVFSIAVSTRAVPRNPAQAERSTGGAVLSRTLESRLEGATH